MKLTANVGTADRILPIVLGLAPIGLTLAGLIGARGRGGLVALVTAYMKFCPAHAILGLKTCKDCWAVLKGDPEMSRSFWMIGAVVLMTGLPAAAGPIRSSVDAAALSAVKTTPLGLYLTPADAAAALAADDGIVFIDVRDPVEVSFVGHAEGIDAIVPVELATHRFNEKGGDYAMAANPDFLTEAAAVVAREGKRKDDPVFVICRSGNRSAAAVRMLSDAGFTNVWNLVEGFEGDRDKASGHRDTNGWRNAGLPWSYKLAAAQAWQPAAGN